MEFVLKFSEKYGASANAYIQHSTRATHVRIVVVIVVVVVVINQCVWRPPSI